MRERSFNRREILLGSAAGLTLAVLPDWFTAALAEEESARLARLPRRIGPNNTIAVGCIGPGGSKGGYRQGLGDTRQIAQQPGVKVLAVCDVDRDHCAEAAKVFGPDCAQFRDFREVLARKEIDAVVIGTPDHWHATIAIAAMRSGKDVYCEKPLTLTIEEGKALVRVQKETGRVFQVGSQQRSENQQFRLACELMRNGRLGKIKKIFSQIGRAPGGGPFQPQPVPEGFDWDFWLGPAPWTEYMKERTHGTFRWWREYSGGMVTDWGAHHNDIAQWALGMDDSGPVRVESKGEIPNIPNGYNVATKYEITYTYANGVPVVCTSEGENGVRFEGESGWIFVNRSKIEASEERILKDPLPGDAVRLYNASNHKANFVDCVRSRKDAICTAEIGHRSVSVCHIGNISLFLGGRKLEWDPKAERFKGDEEANRMLSRPMRSPWKL